MFILIFLFGILVGFTLTIASLWLVKVKCPQCKKLKPLPQIILFDWKQRIITGQLCQNCQRPKPQINIEL